MRSVGSEDSYGPLMRRGSSDERHTRMDGRSSSDERYTHMDGKCYAPECAEGRVLGEGGANPRQLCLHGPETAGVCEQVQ